MPEGVPTGATAQATRAESCGPARGSVQPATCRSVMGGKIKGPGSGAEDCAGALLVRLRRQAAKSEASRLEVQRMNHAPLAPFRRVPPMVDGWESTIGCAFRISPLASTMHRGRGSNTRENFPLFLTMRPIGGARGASGHGGGASTAQKRRRWSIRPPILDTLRTADSHASGSETRRAETRSTPMRSRESSTRFARPPRTSGATHFSSAVTASRSAPGSILQAVQRSRGAWRPCSRC